MTPFEAVYGVPPPNFLSYVPGISPVQAVDDYLRDRDTILRELRLNLSRAQERMKNYVDQHRREVTFEVGDYVYLKLQPYRQTTVAFRSSLKLSPRYFGPYEVINKVGPVAYRLALPSGSLIHNVFHVSILRKHLGPVSTVSTQLPLVTEESIILPQPETVLDRRTVQKNHYRPKAEILVKWKGAPFEDATWEDARCLSQTYSDFPCGQGNLRGED